MADLRAHLLQLLRVPAEPEPPPGDATMLRTFRAAPRYFHYRLALWALRQLSALAALIGGWIFLHIVTAGTDVLPRFFSSGWAWLELLALATFLIQLPISYMLLRLDFELRWYVLSDRSLRIREGILVVREKTMAFANVQNISIRQNPLQRLFGLSSVAVRAAGGGSGGEHKGSSITRQTREAHFEGVDNGEHIRDVIRDRIRLHRDSGLGDPDDAEPIAAAGTSPLHAARALLEEARALRTSFAR